LTLPTVGLLAGRQVSGPLATLLVQLSKWCRPQAADPAEAGISAWIASDPNIQRLEDLFEFNDAKVAVWADSIEELEHSPWTISDFAAVLTGDERLVDKGAIWIQLPVEIRRSPYFAPHIRGRWRRRFRLPEIWSLDLRGSSSAVPRHLWPTAMSLASAVVVDGDGALASMASGAPCITDSATAAWLKARDGIDVVVAQKDQVEVANRVASDEKLSAALSRAGRRLIEEGHDWGRIAERVAISLGLQVEPQLPSELLARDLASLGMSPGSGVAEDLNRALLPLGITFNP
jgi:hypothetical protein